ncbi:M48 family metalloprotease [Halobiforma nitratireducens]|uniref:Heat shock protein HtpX n=1 Tax=Halobiforma nitratireducens JCM 10879 TaxID=1227454 RepID=M0MBI3_9EURY|nr:M48 family metalloprotease [Halobiforma nitratireducens]EMA41765.1 heat shock protein HtpX [Halobiforma nitratireducens JCM 10879]
MLAAVGGLLAVAAVFLAGVWGVFYLLFAIVTSPGTSAAWLATVVAAATLGSIGYLEYGQPRRIERLADAHRVDRETAPELYETTTRIAAQLDVPVPTIAVSDRDAPEAMAVGFRPSDVRLVLSLGTIDALTDDELEAVIAHELAHVKNRDAMVMTLVSVPVVLAGGLRARFDRLATPDRARRQKAGRANRNGEETDNGAAIAFVAVPFIILSTAVWVVGRAVSARLSRARERAADRAAAEATGSPAALASALRRLDHDIAETPTRDLREAAGVSSLSILPLEPRELEKVMLGPDGETEPSYWWFRTRLHRLERWLFGTHPPTEERIEALSARARERDQDRETSGRRPDPSA